MRTLRIAGLTLAAAVISNAAGAASLTGSSPGFHYFYKQGATMDEHDAALVDCAVRLRAMVNGSNTFIPAPATGGGFAAGALAGLVGGIVDGNEERQGAAANTEGCMAIKGWSVIALTDDEGKAMEQPDDPATIREKLRPLVEAPSPKGSVLRGPFANELAVGDFAVGPARDLEEISISVRAAKDQTEAAIKAAGELKQPKPVLPDGAKKPKIGKPLANAEIAAADPDKAYIAVRMIGRKSTMAKAVSLAFKRLAPDGSEIIYDGAVITIEVGSKATNKGTIAGEKYQDYVFDVPPGRWKFSEITQFRYGAALCFGAPVVEVVAGDAIFVGAMHLEGEGGYPIESKIEIGKEILAANPALAEKVKAAEWTNGYTSDCFGSYAYAYEIPGAPFIDMNALAGGAVPATDEAPLPADTISSSEDAGQ